MLLNIGDKAPNFSLPDANGDSISLSDFKNQKIVVASELLKNVVRECEIKNYKIVKSFKGGLFEGTICDHPLKKLGYNIFKRTN